ncbi:MAG: hypothetical protein CVV24_00495 [Ignavibacteriae bacterium HGW-Ignavibacteriae-3]|nr:MAG: hypothetical protein CVV24_00495 [Ignavibacteriae bacterium HGW-Ignavibacteriae-3]
MNSEYVKIDELKLSDEDLIFKYPVNHQFHTGSTIAESILENWENEKTKFVKILPRAIETVNYGKIYEEQFKNRLLEVFKV